MRVCWYLALCVLALAMGRPAYASNTVTTSEICDRAGAEASRNTGVPFPVLQAITLTETGRKLEGRHRPWPWTVNMEGVGKWFATQAEALAYVKAHHARGARSFDVGCFQINFRWHGQAFGSIEEMFDPLQNALYAGRFLKRLHAETGSWGRSAGAYHSRTPKYATRYQARFERILAKVTGAPPPPRAPEEYAHNMTDAEPAREPEPQTPEPETAWVPPPPSKYGSLAAIDAPQGSRLLLIRPNNRLY